MSREDSASRLPAYVTLSLAQHLNSGPKELSTLIERQLEPEYMDDAADSQSYDDMDHSGVNRCFVEDFLRLGPAGDEVLDLGTGTARIPIELCRQTEDCRVLGTDAAVSMLEIAKINIAIEGFEHRIQLHHGDSKQLEFEDSMFDSVISNSLLHHIPDPAELVAEIVRVVRPGGRIFVRDLVRPENMAEVDSLVAQHASQESDENRQLLRQSLIAALTLDEAAALVKEHGFSAETMAMTSDRHWTWACVKPPTL